MLVLVHSIRHLKLEYSDTILIPRSLTFSICTQDLFICKKVSLIAPTDLPKLKKFTYQTTRTHTHIKRLL